MQYKHLHVLIGPMYYEYVRERAHTEQVSLGEMVRRIIAKDYRLATAKRNGPVRRERLRIARSIGRHTPRQWNALLKEVDGVCVRCGGTGSKLTKDHIVPLYEGGSDLIDNLQPLCLSCNASKDDQTNYLAKWREKRRGDGI